ncbi:MAG TPA: cysteine synthase A [Candidatus Faecalibacterium faecigallinarum]|uniref:Cysteine synthase n=1 Tax=Candidatus Faecalibacterium faecigallinarum TaxID=2838577 RepID=A0A9D2P716_9FIRM|nr:cysteine synthase A [Candidatus Faecalibacterium faecigallinarum]
MSKIYTSADQLIGHTPLLELCRLEQSLDLRARLLVKLESFNPAGSVKDRVAKAMLDEAEAAGRLGPGAVIIEPTSGNTGIGLASVAAARGYRVIIVMPDTMSAERRALMKAYGAELVLTPGAGGMAAAIAKADELAAGIPGAMVAGQFVNPANPAAHEATTGPELWQDTDGQLDVFVAGVGTGGTITGVGRYLKRQNPAVRIVAVEPARSAVLSGSPAGAHGLQGIGAGFVPEVLDTGVYDEVLTATEQDAYAAARLLGRREGVLAGISSGAALWAAIEVCRRADSAGKTVVALLPDTGDRYLSTDLFAEDA